MTDDSELRRISLLLPQETSAALKDEARKRNKTVNSYLRSLIEVELGHPLKVRQQGKHRPTSVYKAQSLEKEIDAASRKGSKYFP